MVASRFVPRPQAMRDFRQVVARGVLNACYLIEGRSKALTPVHGDPSQGGDFATFAPGEKPIGGTLRRSEHSVVFVDGHPLEGMSTVDQNGTPFPHYDAGAGVVGFVGTHIFYAAFVHDGTSKMRARPFLVRAMAENADKLPGVMADGMKRYLGRFP